MSQQVTSRKIDLGSEFTAPLMARVTRAANVVVFFLVANRATRIVLECALWVVLIAKLLEMAAPGIASGSRWLIAFGAMVVVELLLNTAFAQQRIASAFDRWVMGKPAFGDLGGVGRRAFRAYMRSCAGLKIEFSERDQREVVDSIAESGREYTEAIFRVRYDEAVAAGTVDPAVDDWDSVWKRILDREEGGISIRKVNESDVPLADVVNSRFALEQTLLFPIAAIYSLVMAWLVARAAQHPDTAHILLAAQVGLAGGVVLAALIYINHVYTFSEITVVEPPDAMYDQLPEPQRTEFRERAAAIPRGQVLRPTSFSYTADFITAARDFFTTVMARITLLNSLTCFAVAAVVLTIGTLVTDQSADAAVTYGWRLAVGGILIPVVFGVGSWLAFGAFTNLRRFQVLFVAAIATTVLPPLITLIFTGHLGDKNTTLITSIATGLVSAVAATLAEVVKDNGPRDQAAAAQA